MADGPRRKRAPKLCQGGADAGSSDNVTGALVDILDLPRGRKRFVASRRGLPIPDLPAVGHVVNDFRLDAIIADGRYSRLMRATDLRGGKCVVLKFRIPRSPTMPPTGSPSSMRLGVRAGAKPHDRRNIELQTGPANAALFRDAILHGETLEERLKRDPKIDLLEGTAIAARLARAITTLHRSGVIHRDIKPENVILLRDHGLPAGRPRRQPRAGPRRFPPRDIPGTPSYMAPELFLGAAGDESSISTRSESQFIAPFSGRYPYGEIEPSASRASSSRNR